MNQKSPHQKTLANFSAVIVTEIWYPQSSGQSPDWVIEATHEDGTIMTITVPAKNFRSGRWIEGKLGAKWIVFAGCRSRLVDQIQRDSLERLTQEHHGESGTNPSLD